VDECKPLPVGRSSAAPIHVVLSDGYGRAVQVDPIKPTLKAPGTERSKLKCDGLHSTFAFKFNLRRYTSAAQWAAPPMPSAAAAGAYTRPPLRST